MTENRLIKITYPGSANNSTFTYDALGRCVQIVETSGGTVTSTKQFVWSNGLAPHEARNASSAITAQYFSLGEKISGTSYYYTKDHLGSIREMTNTSGAIQGQYAYDPYGQVNKIAGSGPVSDFQYAGYYYHSPSALSATLNRAYSASMGRWLNRDPIEERGGINLYGYVLNNPISITDPSGLDGCHKPKPGEPGNPLKGSVSTGPGSGDGPGGNDITDLSGAGGGGGSWGGDGDTDGNQIPWYFPPEARYWPPSEAGPDPADLIIPSCLHLAS